MTGSPAGPTTSRSIRSTATIPARRGGTLCCVTAAAYFPTKVVTVDAPSAALKVPLATVTAVFEARLSVDEVTHGVIDAGAFGEPSAHR